MRKFDFKQRTLAAPNAEHLAFLAAMVAVEAPARPSSEYGTAYISWRLINMIRAALDAIDFDWQTAAKKRFELEREERIEETQKKYGPKRSPELLP